MVSVMNTNYSDYDYDYDYIPPGRKKKKKQVKGKCSKIQEQHTKNIKRARERELVAIFRIMVSTKVRLVIIRKVGLDLYVFILRFLTGDILPKTHQPPIATTPIPITGYAKLSPVFTCDCWCVNVTSYYTKLWYAKYAIVCRGGCSCNQCAGRCRITQPVAYDYTYKEDQWDTDNKKRWDEKMAMLSRTDQVLVEVPGSSDEYEVDISPGQTVDVDNTGFSKLSRLT